MKTEDFIRMRVRKHLHRWAIKEIERGSNLIAVTHNLGIKKMDEPAEVTGSAADDAFEMAEYLLKIADEVAEEPL